MDVIASDISQLCKIAKMIKHKLCAGTKKFRSLAHRQETDWKIDCMVLLNNTSNMHEKQKKMKKHNIE